MNPNNQQIDQEDENYNSHPLEKIFNIDPGSTPIFADTERENFKNEIINKETGELIPKKLIASKDDLDIEERSEDLFIDEQLDVVYNSALESYQDSSRLAKDCDPKFAARNSEVAAEFLEIALKSLNSRIDGKYKRQKISVAKSSKNVENVTTNNNIILTGNRNDVLRNIATLINDQTIEVIDQEPIIES